VPNFFRNYSPATERAKEYARPEHAPRLPSRFGRLHRVVLHSESLPAFPLSLRLSRPTSQGKRKPMKSLG
jgi:hypothetical protein